MGAPMPPAPIVMADRTQKKNYWRTVPGQHCLLAEVDIGAPIYWRTDAPAPLLLADRWFHFSYWLTEQFGAPRLLTKLNKQETEIR
jgi:hypothetical protein